MANKYAWTDKPYGKLTILTSWREEHPGQPDPDDDALQAWLVAMERQNFTEEWQAAHPGQRLPDYPKIRRWCIDQHNMAVLDMMRERGDKFH